MKAYSYLRFSTAEQSKGDSLRRQIEASRKYASDNGLELDESLTLQDLGLSAFDKTNITKGQLGAFVKAVEMGRISTGSYLLVESLDRLSRAQVMEALQQFIAILNLGIVIVTISDGQIYSKASVDNNFTQLIMSIVLMARAHEESLTKSKRIGEAWKKKVEKALSGSNDGKLLTKHTPLWMRIEDGKLALIPERAALIRRMQSMVKEGLSTTTIAKIFNAESIPAWTANNKWAGPYIGQLTRNTALYGAFSTADKVGEIGYYPAVCTKEEFEHVRHIIEQRINGSGNRRGTKRGKLVTNLFSGIIRCGHCGSTFGVCSTLRKRLNKPPIHYYLCNGRRTGTTECKAPYWDVKEFEALMLFYISQIDTATALGASRSDMVDRLERAFVTTSNAIELLETQIQNITDAIADTPIKSLIAKLSDLERELEVKTKEKTQLEYALSASRATNTAGDHMSNLIHLHRKMLECKDDVIAIRQIREVLFESVHTIIDNVTVFSGGPACTNAELRYAEVTFKSGQMRTVSEA